MSVVQKRNDELVEILRPDFVGNDGTASPTFTDEYLTGSHRASVSVGVRVYRDAAFVHNNTGNWLTIDFNQQRWDDPDDNQWAVAPNPTRLTCQFDGIYVITGHIQWLANGVGRRQLSIYLNSTTFVAITTHLNVTAQLLFQSLATTYKLSVGDFVELRGWQNSGGNLNITAVGNYTPEFSMVRVA